MSHRALKPSAKENLVPKGDKLILEEENARLKELVIQLSRIIARNAAEQK